MDDKKHYTVVRNAGYGATEFKTRQRHNERQNENYYNGDIVAERSPMNHHYLQYLFPDGTPVTYEQRYNQLLASDIVVKRGLKPDAKVFAELVFDVNTIYFEENGAYEFAKKFYDEVYNLAVKEVGDERYILSAVLHADERNKEASERLGYDVFHYHLHVVYIPVVEKKVYHRKDCKDKEKAGTLKETIAQISHSKKWPIKVQVERDGKTISVNSYSLLQDRYYEHMIAAGFPNLERGEFGSTREHLTTEEYKLLQEKERVAEAKKQVEQTMTQLANLELQTEKKKLQNKKLDETIHVKEKAKATISEIEAIGKPVLIGSGFTVTTDEIKRLKTLAKKSVSADKLITDSKNKMAALDKQILDLNLQLRDAKAEVYHWHREYTTLVNEVKDYIGAIRKFPIKLKEFIGELFRPEREAEQQRQLDLQANKKKSKSKGIEL